MDTNQYNNILKAMGAGNASALNAQQQADNYDLFSKMMKDGVYLPDLVKKIDTMEARIKELEKGPKQTQMDIDLFAVMESAVKNEDSVRYARQKVQDEKSRVLSEICIRDEQYRKALEEYRREVNASYIRHKERTDGSGHIEIREESVRQGTSEKGDTHIRMAGTKN